ncbi:hypothetical protein OHA25_08025 [Nonomuraea sp. NBC_00507]|uniref:hypothetical protein n=1 Tax=Nonomuraea sp. NBC_00507 TaxID=2976002 RepID=UPI002E194A4D
MTDSGRSLRDALEDYLALRRALGFRLAAPARLLGQFVGYLEARSASTITIARPPTSTPTPRSARSSLQPAPCGPGSGRPPTRP